MFGSEVRMCNKTKLLLNVFFYAKSYLRERRLERCRLVLDDFFEFFDAELLLLASVSLS